MKDFVISTDTASDLSLQYCKEHQIDMHSLFYRFGEDELYGNEKQLPIDVFYQRMRDGEMPTTMATNPEDSVDLFRKQLTAGHDILHIAFSSGLSGSYQSAVIAADQLKEEFPESQIIVIDSLCASAGEGLLVYKAMAYKDAGHSLEETADYVRATAPFISHQFTVDSLFHLQRGGRVSKATAIVGTIIGIKPLLHVDDAGKLVSIGKARGRKKSLTSLVDAMMESIGEHDNSTIMISHGDCYEDAKFVGDLIQERNPKVTNVIINVICPTIGAHAGPGTVALFFEADHR